MTLSGLLSRFSLTRGRERFYLGQILQSEPSATPPITAIFNAPIVQIPGIKTPLLFPRVMTKNQKSGEVDVTAWIGVYALNEHRVSLVGKIFPKDILGGSPKNKGINVEDLRIIVTEDGTLVCGATAVTPDKIVHPAIFTMRYPFKPSDITKLEVIHDLPSGKNLIPLSPDLMMYRRNTADDRVIIIRREEGNKWIIAKEILFPHISNAKQKTRIGLNSGVTIPMGNGHFRLILHENFIDQKTGIVEYAFRLAEFKLDKEGLPELVKVDGQRLMLYRDAREIIDPYYTGNEPDPNKRVIYNVGALWQYPEKGEPNLLLPVTLYDREIELFSLPLSLLQRPFHGSIRALKRILGAPSFSVRPKWAFLR